MINKKSSAIRFKVNKARLAKQVMHYCVVLVLKLTVEDSYPWTSVLLSLFPLDKKFCNGFFRNISAHR